MFKLKNYLNNRIYYKNNNYNLRQNNKIYNNNNKIKKIKKTKIFFRKIKN